MHGTYDFVCQEHTNSLENESCLEQTDWSNWSLHALIDHSVNTDALLY